MRSSRAGHWLTPVPSKETAVTGATTALVNRWHYCTGTSYTITLPAAASYPGEWIGFRMGPIASLTGRVTLDGNSTETIDGSLTRLMWANESAVIISDGSNWYKVAGKSVPMFCQLSLSATQSGVTTGGGVAVQLNTADDDNTTAMAVTASNRIDIVRPGNYLLIGCVTWITTASAILIPYITIGGSIFCQTSSYQASSGTFSAPTMKLKRGMAAGDQVQLYGNHNSGNTESYYGDGTFKLTYLSVEERPSW